MMKRLKVDVIVNFLNKTMDVKNLPFDEFIKFRNLVINKLGMYRYESYQTHM